MPEPRSTDEAGRNHSKGYIGPVDSLTEGRPVAEKGLMRAVSTPLASIFGSGFLVIVPVLAGSAGRFSLPAMAGIAALAYAVGWVIRSNISLAEPVIENGGGSRSTVLLDRISDVALVPAYIISVCLYLRILSSFLLNGFGLDSIEGERLVTSAFIFFICLIGLTRGLRGLQKMEGWAIWVTMAIIATMIVAFAFHDAELALGPGLTLPAEPGHGLLHTLAILGGTLICVQGFETSRYLGEEYDRPTRIRSCRLSQIIAAGVYMVFIAVATPMMHYLTGPVADDALVALAGRVSVLLPVPLIAAAVLSQFSATVADTLGGEGNIVEATRRRLGHRAAYLIIGTGAILLAWSASTMEIVALASRAFALYYMLQCLVAFTVVRGAGRKTGSAALALLMLAVTVFATPVG